MRRERVYQCPFVLPGALPGTCTPAVAVLPGEAFMQVLYERCAAVDVGKDVIAVAVRRPGRGGTGG